MGCLVLLLGDVMRVLGVAMSVFVKEEGAFKAKTYSTGVATYNLMTMLFTPTYDTFTTTQ
jgi:hypothetical protein